MKFPLIPDGLYKQQDSSWFLFGPKRSEVQLRKKLLSSGIYRAEIASQSQFLRIKKDFYVCEFHKAYKLLLIPLYTLQLNWISSQFVNQPLIRLFQDLALLSIWETVLAGNHCVAAGGGSCGLEDIQKKMHVAEVRVKSQYSRKEFPVKFHV